MCDGLAQLFGRDIAHHADMVLDSQSLGTSSSGFRSDVLECGPLNW
jgi:hypothetical protein